MSSASERPKREFFIHLTLFKSENSNTEREIKIRGKVNGACALDEETKTEGETDAATARVKKTKKIKENSH